MGRSLRLTYRGALHHVTMRCNNKEFLFDEQSCHLFLDLLRETCERHHAPLYNYCLMTNHVHLLFEVNTENTLSPLMHRLANVFAKRFNAVRGRKGHLWEGRFVSTIVEAPSYFLRCMAYIDLNPVRAGIAPAPAEYRWGAHRHLAAEDETVIRLHKHYLELGEDSSIRYENYVRLLAEEAARKPYSLAGVLFVGTKRFVKTMQGQFGIESDKRPRVRSVALGEGIEATERQGGGSSGRKTQS